MHPLPYRSLLFDADGTIRRCTIPNQTWPTTSEEWELLPNVKETLELYDRTVVRCGVVSNQADVGYGYLTSDDVYGLLVDCAKAAFYHKGAIYIRFCSHIPDLSCPCRKPSPYMLLQQLEDMTEGRIQSLPGVLNTALYVGDMEADHEAAQRAGIDFMWAHEFFNW